MDNLVKLATILSPLVSGCIAIWAILIARKTIDENKEIAKKQSQILLIKNIYD